MSGELPLSFHFRVYLILCFSVFPPESSFRSVLRLCRNLYGFEFYFPSFLCTAFTISMIGMIRTARPRAITYSVKPIGVNWNAFAINGTSITTVVRIRETTIAPYRNLLWLFSLKIDHRRLLMLREWKISTMERVRNAMVVPSALFTNSHAPDSIL